MHHRNINQIPKDSNTPRPNQYTHHKHPTESPHYLKKDEFDGYGQNGVNTLCAFHPSERITNFCTNKQCLLPLCPKCVKIHTDEHIKMGIFGQFDTIEQTLKMAEDGLGYSFQKLSQFERVINEIKGSYQSKITLQRKKVRQAKNYYVQLIERVFENIQKALISFEKTYNQQFIEQLYLSEKTLASLSQHLQKCSKKMKLHQNLMEGVISFYSEAHQIQRVDVFSQKLHRIFPEPYQIVYHSEELAKTQSAIKRYLLLGQHNQSIWNIYESTQSNSHKKTAEIPKFKHNTAAKVYSPPKKSDERYGSPKTQKSAQKSENERSDNNTKMSSLSQLQGKLNLDKFKSPLDVFSLSKIRSNRGHND